MSYNWFLVKQINNNTYLTIELYDKYASEVDYKTFKEYLDEESDEQIKKLMIEDRSIYWKLIKHGFELKGEEEWWWLVDEYKVLEYVPYLKLLLIWEGNTTISIKNMDSIICLLGMLEC